MFGRTRARTSGQGGFTLVEPLVAMIVLSILAGISTKMFLGQRGRAYDVSAVALLRDAAITVEVADTATQGYAAITPARLMAINPGIHFQTTVGPRASAGEVRIVVGASGFVLDTISTSGATYVFSKTTLKSPSVARTCGVGCTW